MEVWHRRFKRPAIFVILDLKFASNVAEIPAALEYLWYLWCTSHFILSIYVAPLDRHTFRAMRFRNVSIESLNFKWIVWTLRRFRDGTKSVAAR